MANVGGVTLQQAERALEAMYERHAETQRWIVLFSLIALAHEARQALPQVATLEFEWSDQGPFLSLRGLLDANDKNLDEDGEVERDDNTYAWNLGEDNKSAWEPHMTKFRPEGWGSDLFHLNVDEALAIRPFQKEQS